MCKDVNAMNKLSFNQFLSRVIKLNAICVKLQSKEKLLFIRSISFSTVEKISISNNNSSKTLIDIKHKQNLILKVGTSILEMDILVIIIQNVLMKVISLSLMITHLHRLLKPQVKIAYLKYIKKIRKNKVCLMLISSRLKHHRNNNLNLSSIK